MLNANSLMVKVLAIGFFYWRKGGKMEEIGKGIEIGFRCLNCGAR